jgi:hypothetical protein
MNLNQHRKYITQRLIEKFSDDEQLKEGLSAFFPSITSPTKLVSIEVQRNNQKVAVDVQRCTDPVRNTFSKSTEKIFQPPYYNEMFDFTACERYEETFARENMPTTVDAQMLLTDASSYLMALKNKILRAIEVQRSQVLQTGIVKLKNGDSIDYKRKAESMKVLTGDAQWNNAESNPMFDFVAGMEFIRGKGLSGGSTINAIFGSNALTNFMSNAKVKELADFQRINRIDLSMPQFDGVSGMVYHGRLAAGDYVVNVWTYGATYEDPESGETKSYIGKDNVVMVSDDFVGRTAFAGIPAILGDNVSGQYIGPVEGEFYIRDVIDQIKASWDFIVSSAPLVIPVSVDRLYTITTVDPGAQVTPVITETP